MSGPSLIPADVLVSSADQENAYDILVIRWLFSLVPCYQTILWLTVFLLCDYSQILEPLPSSLHDRHQGTLNSPFKELISCPKYFPTPASQPLDLGK